VEQESIVDTTFKLHGEKKNLAMTEIYVARPKSLPQLVAVKITFSHKINAEYFRRPPHRQPQSSASQCYYWLLFTATWRWNLCITDVNM